MDYENHYNKLINKRQKQVPIDEYTENHHIVPKCLGGTNDKSNIVKLTAREHFLAHWLLTKIHPNEWKLFFAMYQMTKSYQHQRIVTSRQFALGRKKLSEGAKLRYQLGLHPRKTEAGRKILSAKMKGDLNPMRKWPEKNPKAYPVEVVFDNGTKKQYKYNKLAYTELNIPKSTWIFAVRKNKGIPKYGIKQINKI